MVGGALTMGGCKIGMMGVVIIGRGWMFRGVFVGG
jgi:hypothetical protein